MRDILKSINTVLGVTGCFVCDDKGQVLASALPDLFDKATLSTVGRTMTQTIAGLATTRRRKIGDIDLVYAQSRLITKNLGEGCLCILCVRNINAPLLNLTANAATRKLREKITGREKEPERTEATPVGLPEALQAMAVFLEQLMEELGDKGFGREDLLKVIKYRLTKLEASFPFLQSVSVIEGKVHLPLPSEPIDAREVGEALGALIKGVCYSARAVLGPKETEAKYRQVYDSFYRQNRVVFEGLGLGQTLEKAATEEPFLPLAGVDLSFN